MKELYRKYQALIEQAETENNRTYELISKKKASVTRLRNQIEKLENKVYNYPSWYEVILNPLAFRLSQDLHLPYEIYGPFGLSCETSIYFRADMQKSICDQPVFHLTVYPNFGREIFCLEYDTGERTHEYEDGSIGELNGWNKRRAPLPETYAEVLELVKKNYMEQAV